MANGKRLLFFDVLRIVSVALIVFYHIAIVYNWVPFSRENLFFNIFYMNPGMIGVALMIFVSGAVLEYSHRSLSDLGGFYVKRLFRIYPAFWMSMIIGLICAPGLATLPPLRILLEFTGFNTWSGGWGGQINSVGWFVGLIVALYFLYPSLSSSIKKYPYFMLVFIAFTETFFRFALNVWDVPIFGRYPDRWLPVCNLLEFSLGIWMVQQNAYPKWTYGGGGVFVLAELSFYVFLIHGLGNMLQLANTSLLLYGTAVGLLAWLMMLGDQKIQMWLKKKIPIRGNTT